MANSKDKDWERKQLILQYAVEARKFEIEHFWKRSLYFWGLVAAALIAFAALNKVEDQYFRTATICFGLITSVAWSLQNRGSKYWQEAWEQKVERAQKDVLEIDLFKHKEDLLPEKKSWENYWLRSRQYSVSKLAIAMSDLAVVLWVTLGGFNAFYNTTCEVDYKKAAMCMASFVFIAVISYFGRSTKDAD